MACIVAGENLGASICFYVLEHGNRLKCAFLFTSLGVSTLVVGLPVGATRGQEFVDFFFDFLKKITDRFGATRHA